MGTLIGSLSAFRCPSCGKPLDKTAPDPKSNGVLCGYCGASVAFYSGGGGGSKESSATRYTPKI